MFWIGRLQSFPQNCQHSKRFPPPKFACRGGVTWETIDNNSPTGFGGTFENTETSDLTITSVEGLDGYQFQLIAMNGACSAITQPVTLNVEDLLPVSASTNIMHNTCCNKNVITTSNWTSSS